MSNISISVAMEIQEYYTSQTSFLRYYTTTSSINHATFTCKDDTLG